MGCAEKHTVGVGDERARRGKEEGRSGIWSCVAEGRATGEGVAGGDRTTGETQSEQRVGDNQEIEKMGGEYKKNKQWIKYEG